MNSYWRKHGPALLAGLALALLMVIVMLAGILGTYRRSGIGVVKVTAAALENRAAIRQLHRLGAMTTVRAIVLDLHLAETGFAAAQAAGEEVRKLQRQGKPVVASIADAAAGGGYYLACCTGKIFANPGSLIAGLEQGPEDDPREEAFQDLRRQFQSAVLDSRALRLAEVLASQAGIAATEVPPDQLQQLAAALAGGQRLSGRQAWQSGWVDHLGNLDDAVRDTGRKAGFPGPVRVIPAPRRRE